jgi:ribonuclease VapC
VIVDSSALIAIMLGEADAAEYAGALASTTEAGISVATYLEAGIIADRDRDPVAMRVYDTLLTRNGIVIEPVTAEQAHIARAAYRDFGRGSGHPAKLNFGDCFSYALAKTTGRPLLFKGDDFGHTDVTSALGQSRT